MTRLPAGAVALKDASRRASARWPRKDEAILDRDGPRCLGMVRPGRENGTTTEPENVDRGRWLANTPVTTKDERDYFVAAGPCYCLRCPGTGGKITECLIVVSQGWGSPQFSDGSSVFSVPLW